MLQSNATYLGIAITTFIFQMQTKYRRCNRAKNGGSTRICKKTQIKRRSCNKRRCCEFYPNSIITMSKRRQKCSIKAWVPEKVVLFWSFTKPFPRSSNVLMAREGPGTRIYRCPLPGRAGDICLIFQIIAAQRLFQIKVWVLHGSFSVVKFSMIQL